MSGWPLLAEDSSFSGVQGGAPSPGTSLPLAGGP